MLLLRSKGSKILRSGILISSTGTCQISGPLPSAVAASKVTTWDDVLAAMAKIIADCQQSQPVDSPVVGGVVDNCRWQASLVWKQDNGSSPLTDRKAQFLVGISSSKPPMSKFPACVFFVNKF